MGFLRLLRRLARLSGAVDVAIDDTADIVRRKAALVTIVMTSLGIVEDKLKRDLANDAKVQEAATHLAEAVFDSIDAVRQPKVGGP